MPRGRQKPGVVGTYSGMFIQNNKTGASTGSKGVGKTPWINETSARKGDFVRKDETHTV